MHQAVPRDRRSRLPTVALQQGVPPGPRGFWTDRGKQHQAVALVVLEAMGPEIGVSRAKQALEADRRATPAARQAGSR